MKHVIKHTNKKIYKHIQDAKECCCVNKCRTNFDIYINYNGTLKDKNNTNKNIQNSTSSLK